MYDENGKKIDGRRFNGGNKGCGRKPKAYETKLAEKLTPYNDDIIQIMVTKALEGDKDMIKLYMGYLHGQPKVKSENETTVTTQSIEQKKLLDKLKYNFEDDNDDDFFKD